METASLKMAIIVTGFWEWNLWVNKGHFSVFY